MPPVSPRLAHQRTALFLAVATSWVVLSDQLAFSLPLQAADQHLVQTFKGLVFALLLAPLLYWRLERLESSPFQAARGHARATGRPWLRRGDSAALGQAETVRHLAALSDVPQDPGCAAHGPSPGLGAGVARRCAVEAALLHAALDDEFSLHLQPKWCITTQRTIGAEALLRWNSATLGQVSPDEFIPIAEKHRVIRDLGRWVVRRVLRELAARRGQHEHLQVSINLSARQLDDETFPGFVAAAVAKAGLSPSRLQFELTETSLVQNQAAARAFLMELRAHGFTVALDDFGAGYSSLSYLAQFPVDVLKLDRSFVEQLPHNPRARVVASSIIEMAGRLNIQTVAEGVETEMQRAILEAAGCHQAQGWLVCKALPVGDFFRRANRHLTRLAA